jgi:pyruvate/2-oxoglutarate/acetoin dehydrogenase E1 component
MHIPGFKVAVPSTPRPFSPALEKEFIPSEAKIIPTVKEVVS